MEHLRVAAIDVGATKIAGGVVEFHHDGRQPTIICRHKVPSHVELGGEALLANIADVANTVIDACPVKVAGIGIATAGIIHPKTGVVVNAIATMPGWKNQPVKAYVQEHTGYQVSVLNDLHGHALGEARWGAGQDRHSFLSVAIGTGIGSAYVFNGHVMRGFRGVAGHSGHTPHGAANDLPCPCGGSGHVATVISGMAIASKYQGRDFMAELDPDIMGGEISRRAADGDEKAIAVLNEAGKVLGEAMAGWCNILDPECIVLSGSVTNAGACWEKAMRDAFHAQVFPPLKDMEIIYGVLGGDAPLLGAAEEFCDRHEIPIMRVPKQTLMF